MGFHGINTPDSSFGTNLSTAALFIATAHGHTQVIRQLMDVGGAVEMQWLGLTAKDAAAHLERGSALQALRAYESHFSGHISEKRGCDCVVSWPGIYAREWDVLVAQAKKAELSAAVVFLPEGTSDYGAHGSDKCYCVEVGEILSDAAVVD